MTDEGQGAGERTSSERTRRAVELALGVVATVLPLVFHAAFFSSEAIVYLADAAHLQYPRYVVMCDALQAQHAFPLWQDLVYAGAPFHASPENPTLYAPVLFFCAFAGPALAINLVVLTGLAAAGLGMYLFVLRTWKRLEPGASLVGAAGALVASQAFALNQWTRQDHLNLVTYGHAYALFPWILIAAGCLLHGKRPLRAAGVLALLVAADVHTGGLYVFPYVALILALWFVLHGLLGGARARARTLRYGTLAAGLAGLMIAAKLVPHVEWAPTTNRAGPLPFADALGRRLGARIGGSPTWKSAWGEVRLYTGGVWGLLPALFALPLLRHGVVRTIVGLAVFFAAAALGGPAYELLVHLPPFDQIRGAGRAWSAVNLLWPMASGLGTCWLLARLPALRRSALLAGLVGLAVALPFAWRMVHSSPRHDAVLQRPDRVSEVLSRYVDWPRAAELAGDEWRAFYVDKTIPEHRNEQFVTSALGVETPAGYLGHVWPWRLARHVYGEEQERPLDPAVRHRRLAVLSTRWFVTDDPGRPRPDNGGRQLEPQGIDGTAVVENPIARARAVAPAAVAAVAGDPDDELLYALLDRPELPVQHVGLVSLEPGAAVSDAEWKQLDLLVVGEDAPGTAPFVAAASERGITIVELPFPLNDAGHGALRRVAERLAQEAARGTTAYPTFERVRPGLTRLTFDPRTLGPRGRYVVVSEPWSWYPGWTVTSESGDLTLRRADGIVSALFVPPGTSEATATYAPRSFWIGLALGALGLAASLLLLVVGRRAAVA